MIQEFDNHYLYDDGDNTYSLTDYSADNPYGDSSYFEEPEGVNQLEGEFTLSDAGNAQRFVRKFGDIIRYVPDKNFFFLWDGRRWQRDKKNMIMSLAQKVAYSIREEAEFIEDERQAQKVIAWAKKSLSEGKLKAMINLLKTQPKIVVDMNEFDKTSFLLTVRNGVVDLTNGKIYLHNPSDMLTQLVDIDYKPDAVSNKWKKFIDDVTGGDAELANYLQRAVGYSITGSQNEQCFFWVYGPGGNGKSTFLSVIQALLSEFTKNAAPQTFHRNKMFASGPTEELARLSGSRIIIVSEVSKNAPLDEAKLKAFTGGDIISARGLYQATTEFRSDSKIWFQANFRPEIQGDDDGIWRRVKIIPFLQSFKGVDRDLDLVNALTTEEELEGILAWAIQGALMWHLRGLDEPDTIWSLTKELRMESDPIAQFMDQRYKKDPHGKIYAGELYAEYELWCKEVGEEPMDIRKFKSNLEDKGFDHARSSQKAFWRISPI